MNLGNKSISRDSSTSSKIGSTTEFDTVLDFNAFMNGVFTGGLIYTLSVIIFRIFTNLISDGFFIHALISSEQIR